MNRGRYEGIARLRGMGALALICLAVVLARSAEAQGPPVPAASPPETSDLSAIEERLQKLEAMEARLRKLEESNQKLQEENQALRGGNSGWRDDDDQEDAGEEDTAPTAGETLGGGGPNVILGQPETESAAGGESLIGRQAKGIGEPLTGKFGPRFLNNSNWFSSPSGNFLLHVGGRTQLDLTFFSASQQMQFAPDGIGRLRDGVDARRARLRVEGQMYEQMQWVVEYDFVNGFQNAAPPRTPFTSNTFNVPAPLDLWWGFRKLPWIGNFRIGNQKEPYGFERLMSSRFLTFMERSFNTDAFYSPFSNGFSPGIQAFNTFLPDKRGTWAVGLFKNLMNGFVYDVNGGDLAVSGRVTVLPIYEDEGRRLVHLGMSARQSELTDHQWRYRVRGPERAGPSPLWAQYANTGLLNAEGGQQDINLEFVSVVGPWTFESEYNFNWAQQVFQANKPAVGTVFYSGGYVSAAYFLTGEHRAYVKESGLFDRIVPRENAFLIKEDDGRIRRGLGAWQVAFRYNYLNLNDKGVNGGILNDFTTGLNWFLNPNTKVQWNYSVTLRESPQNLSDGVIQGLGMRFAHDF